MHFSIYKRRDAENGQRLLEQPWMYSASYVLHQGRPHNPIHSKEFADIADLGTLLAIETKSRFAEFKPHYDTLQFHEPLPEANVDLKHNRLWQKGNVTDDELSILTDAYYTEIVRQIHQTTQ
jgi:hypothetical protein